MLLPLGSWILIKHILLSSPLLLSRRSRAIHTPTIVGEKEPWPCEYQSWPSEGHSRSSTYPDRWWLLWHAAHCPTASWSHPFFRAIRSWFRYVVICFTEWAACSSTSEPRVDASSVEGVTARQTAHVIVVFEGV